MRSRNVLSLVVLLAATVALVDCRAPDSSGAITSAADLTLDEVAAILDESPEEYLIALQEVVDDSECYGPEDGSSCPVAVRVAEFIAGEPGRPADRRQGWVYSTMEMRMEEALPNRRIGRHRLVVAHPVEAAEGWYGNRVFIVDPTPADIDKLRHIVNELNTGRRGQLSDTDLNLTVRSVTDRACAQSAPNRPAGKSTLYVQ